MNPHRTIVDLRRDLHQLAEVGLHLPQTQNYLVRVLEDAGIEIVLGKGLSSVAAIVRGTMPDIEVGDAIPTVLVRSDMDALPIIEDTGLPWAARNGAMHACGHDCHMAMVLSAALETHRRRDELAGDAVFFFQPGEEGHGGAQLSLEENLLTVSGTRPLAVLGLHVLAHLLEPGEFASRNGAVLSGSTLVDVTFEGSGGHGSAPHLARNPLNTAAEFVGTVTAAVSSGLSMFEPALLTFGALQSGDARNVIPDKAVLKGVIRSFSEESDAQIQTILRRVATGIAEAHDMSVNIRLIQDTIPTMSHMGELDILDKVSKSFGKGVTRLPSPIGISEDFSWVLREVPGVFLLIGARTNDSPHPESNHSPRATFSDDVLAPTTRLITAWVFERLNIEHETTSCIEPLVLGHIQ